METTTEGCDGKTLFASPARLHLAICTSALLLCFWTKADGTNANEFFESRSLESLANRAAQADTNIYSTFVLDLPQDRGYVEVSVGSHMRLCSDIGDRLGCFVGYDNQTDLRFRLLSIPTIAQGIRFSGGRYDIGNVVCGSNIVSCAVDCTDIGVDLQRLLVKFPLIEELSLSLKQLRDVNCDLATFRCLTELRRLELVDIDSCGIPLGNFARSLLSSLPHLQKIHLSGACRIGKPFRRNPCRSKRFVLTGELRQNTSGVLYIPDCDDCLAVELEVSSEVCRTVEFRLLPDRKKLNGVRFVLHNVIPVGESKIVEDGEVSYSIRIDRCSKQVDDNFANELERRGTKMNDKCRNGLDGTEQ